MTRARVGIIGGSGLYQMEGIQNLQEVSLETPFGAPSDAYLIGELEGWSVAFLPRHGRGHRILPSELPFRANIYGMKLLGVERIFSISAVGSMREDVRPGDLLVPDQFYDHTRRRVGTFFGDGVVAHVALADPVCPELSRILVESAEALGYRVHRGGTYLCIEGPQFSTRAESHIYRQWGVDVIGMTNVPEVKLAREAEICYATLALVTDYDCWHEEEEDVTAERILAILHENVERAKKILREALTRLPQERGCACGHALRDALVTAPEHIPPDVRRRLEPILGRYLGGRS